MKGGSLNYHLGRRGPERSGGDRVKRRSSHATFTRLVTIQSLLFIINTKRIRAALLTPLLPGWRSPAHLALQIVHLWWRCLSVVPPFGVLPETKGLGDRWGSPSRCPINWVRAGRHWPARRSPGGGRSRGPVVMGREELARGRRSGGVPF